MTRPRGQTTIDFAVGISIFLVVLIFIFSFVPTLLEPFTAVKQEDPVVADRVADRLSQGALGSPDQPYILDRTCTVEFFATMGSSPPSDCRYTGQELSSRVGMDDSVFLNVTITGNISGNSETETVCWDDTDTVLVSRSASDCDTPFVAGETVPEESASVSAGRVVHLRNQDLTLEVVVW